MCSNHELNNTKASKANEYNMPVPEEHISRAVYICHNSAAVAVLALHFCSFPVHEQSGCSIF